ncbi:Fc receptor-like protein 5 isoform X2 [Gambusia affinis]|uniref:Fc receptor-like protein 5 isoform X2 n=1 Tax=Gambusia affinis TaxID=33528 RepID=UPI001CDB58A9|nr:Fc receptor-like protein 5 isoform X2 [Gambusia affinis]
MFIMTKVLGFILVMNSLLCCGHAEDANLIIDPNWSTFHPEESVTFICDMSEGEETDWQYEIRRNGEQVLQYNPHKSYTLPGIQIGQSGEYQCCGLRKSSDDTDCSDTVSVTVTAQPKAKLTAGPTTIPVGGSVTLRCSVEPSAGWKYRWFRRTQNTQEFELTEEGNRDIKVTQGGIYRCIGKRGNGDYYSVISDEVSFNITFSNEVFVTRQPNWPQIFSGESITLTCEVQEGETTEWTCDWKKSGSIIQRTDSKDWTFTVSESSSGDYMCQCRSRDDGFSSTQWSETLTLSISGAEAEAKLTAGSTTIPVGGSVTLSCSVEPSAGWNYRWFRRTADTPEVQVITNDEENREITVTQGGIYKCEGERGNPSFYSHSSQEKTIEIMFSNEVFVTRQPNWPQIFSGESITLTCEVQEGETTEWTCDWKKSGSFMNMTNSKDWTFTVSESSSGNYTCQCRSRDDGFSSTQWSETITVTVSSSVGSSFPVMLIVGPVVGVVLIVLLLLLWRCRRSKDLSCIRSFQSESSSQRPTSNHGLNQIESNYSSLLHGTTSVYETIQNRGATGNGNVYVIKQPSY